MFFIEECRFSGGNRGFRGIEIGAESVLRVRCRVLVV